MEKDEEMTGEQYLDFDEYIRHGEPSRREAAYAWSTAIGLQAVDGLKTSKYLLETARRNIEGEITIDEALQLINSYYQNKKVRTQDDEDMEEADRVSANNDKKDQPSPDKSPDKLPDKFSIDNEWIKKLIPIIGTERLSIKEMMARINLRDRENFMNLYLKPAIAEGYVSLLYPDKPKHPRQKYLLTAKGILLLKSL